VGQYYVRSSTSAPAAAVWELLIDGRTWPRWASGLDDLVESGSSGLGPDGRDGVGTVRAFRTGRTVTSERLVELVPNRRMVYQDVVNPAIKDYRAVIELTPGAGERTIITWHGTWRARPGLGWVMPFVLPRVMQRMADDLAASAGNTT